jgi:hypothetical protein
MYQRHLARREDIKAYGAAKEEVRAKAVKMKARNFILLDWAECEKKLKAPLGSATQKNVVQVKDHLNAE